VREPGAAELQRRLGDARARAEEKLATRGGAGVTPEAQHIFDVVHKKCVAPAVPGGVAGAALAAGAGAGCGVVALLLDSARVAVVARGAAVERPPGVWFAAPNGSPPGHLILVPPPNRSLFFAGWLLLPHLLSLLPPLPLPAPALTVLQPQIAVGRHKDYRAGAIRHPAAVHA
jgi:hypothetical protein